LVLMIPLNFYVAAREREHIDWTGVSWISIGRFAGTFAGLWILVIVNLHQLSLLIAWSTLIAALIALLAPKFSPNPPVLATVVLVTLRQVSLLIGWSPLFASLIALLAPEFSPNRPVLATVGLIPGVTATSTGIGGPPYALAYQHGPGAELRSTVAVCFLVGEV